MKFREPSAQTHVNVLLYGPAGTGKTAGAATMPGGIWYWNLDLPNALNYAKSKDLEGRLLEVDDSDGVMATMVEVARAVSQPQDIVDTVVIDPIGDLHRKLLEETSNRAIRPTLSAYGDVSTHVERFVRHLCEAPVNLVVVAHEHAVKDETTGEVERLPYTGTTNPAIGQKILGMVDIVGYCGVKVHEDRRREYMAQLINANGRRGKDRFDVLATDKPARALDLAEWLSLIKTPTSNQPQVQEKLAV